MRHETLKQERRQTPRPSITPIRGILLRTDRLALATLLLVDRPSQPLQYRLLWEDPTPSTSLIKSTSIGTDRLAPTTLELVDRPLSTPVDPCNITGYVQITSRDASRRLPTRYNIILAIIYPHMYKSPPLMYLENLDFILLPYCLALPKREVVISRSRSRCALLC